MQVVIEKMLGKSLEQLMQEKLFTPLGMITSAYVWLSRLKKIIALSIAQQARYSQKTKIMMPDH